MGPIVTFVLKGIRAYKLTSQVKVAGRSVRGRQRTDRLAWKQTGMLSCEGMRRMMSEVSDRID